MKKKKTQRGNEHILEISEDGKRKFEIVLKCDSRGSLEAVDSALKTIRVQGIEVKAIHSGVGDVIKSDLLLAVTSSRLVIGFNVGIGPKIEQLCKEMGVEIRLYDIIYMLVDDLKKIVESLAIPDEEQEKIIGKAKVIALFKSGRKDAILGCEVLEGNLLRGQQFRIFSAMGLIYVGKIESLQIEKESIAAARPHQQVGLKILNFKKRVNIGDIIECFKPVRPRGIKAWQPTYGVSVIGQGR